MHAVQTLTRDNMIKRVLLLYGLYTVFSNASLRIGYHFLPEGVLRGHPVVTFVAQEPDFWLHFSKTLTINLFVAIVLGAGLNLVISKEGIPWGYFLIAVFGVIGGLVVGTNSFMDDLSQYSVLEGLSKGLSIGELEVLGRIFIIASTAGISIYKDDTSWYSLHTKFIKLKNFRDIRLSRQEWITLMMGIFLLFIAAYNETVMWFMEIIG